MFPCRHLVRRREAGLVPQLSYGSLAKPLRIALAGLCDLDDLAGVLGWQASFAPTEQQKNECYEAAKKSGHKTEESKTLWEKTTTDPVAFFTFVLSASTIGLWIATIGLFF